MSDIMTIEQLAETSAAELTDSDLLMTSVRNINGSYTSKKMTLNALADYVNSKESESGNVVSKGQVIIGSDSDANSLHSNGNRLNFAGSDIWYGNNVRIGLWGIS